MHFSFVPFGDLDIIEIIVKGLIDHEARKKIIYISWGLLDQNICKKLLINKVDSIRFFDQHMAGALNIIKLMMDLEIFPTALIAVLNKKMEQYDDFFEEMARLKGIPLKNFTNREDAIAWLCHSCF